MLTRFLAESREWRDYLSMLDARDWNTSIHHFDSRQLLGLDEYRLVHAFIFASASELTSLPAAEQSTKPQGISVWAYWTKSIAKFTPSDIISWYVDLSKHSLHMSRYQFLSDVRTRFLPAWEYLSNRSRTCVYFEGYGYSQCSRKVITGISHWGVLSIRNRISVPYFDFHYPKIARFSRKRRGMWIRKVSVWCQYPHMHGIIYQGYSTIIMSLTIFTFPCKLTRCESLRFYRSTFQRVIITSNFEGLLGPNEDDLSGMFSECIRAQRLDVL